MGKSQSSFGKEENEKKRQKKKNEKAERREERQAKARKGQSLDDMLAYVDEFGNITSTPPDPARKQEIKAEDIRIGVARQADDAEPAETPLRRGTVTFFNGSKGYGFIKDQDTQESVFVHVNKVVQPIKENDKVTFEVEMGPKGLAAVGVRLAE